MWRGALLLSGEPKARLSGRPGVARARGRLQACPVQRQNPRNAQAKEDWRSSHLGPLAHNVKRLKSQPPRFLGPTTNFNWRRGVGGEIEWLGFRGGW